MISLKVEQRINLKFLVKLNKTAAESFHTLYGEHCMSCACVFEWHKRFCEGREDVQDDEHSELPYTSKMSENIQKIEQIIRGLSIRMIAEMVSIDKETVWQILHENLNKTKVCAKVVPKLLTPDQKEKQFLAPKQITVVHHPPYSPDLALCDFFLFPKIKSVLKGTLPTRAIQWKNK
uniref:Mos1 transposase HTH domain-containing protein n=1 Tax=Lates calcarifer TaxID=8187 RepID=A0A4W6DFL3_LATCA